MSRHLMVSVKLILVTTFLLGIIYPMTITGLGQLLFPRQANGSVINSSGRVVGSELLGQAFTEPGYFHPRPSAAGTGYDATASCGSNLAPTSKALVDRVRSDSDRLIAENPSLRRGAIPVDMVTTSASGLDPDISPANAYAQIPRVAAARNIPESELRNLVAANTTDRQFGILGEPRVNVLRLNLALDANTGSR
jgi:potassium-transporting ATPase KdpC subunit